MCKVVWVVGVFALLLTCTGAWGEDKWDRADQEVVRLAPSRIPGLPKAVVQELDRRKCLIPQIYGVSEPHNAIQGSFRKKGTKDWAVLCSTAQVSSLLIFWGGSTKDVFESMSSADRNWLQGIGGDKIGFSRSIGRIDPKRISEYNTMGEGPKGASFDHDGIEEGFVEKGSTVYYYNAGAWQTIAGGD